ncbi:MAG: preprotein translocase subunit SecA [Pseudomonadota bacterium]|nr:preprotein translocase subunit SecA [Pseudomonadota bacterium]
MIANPLKRIFGNSHQRTVKRLAKVVQKINALESELAALPDARLCAKTVEFRGRLAKGEALDALLPEAFAVVREAGKRVMNMRHYDVQLMGGMVLHQGKIAEMRTGEGKTLVGTLAVYLNALTGKGVHVVTVNDYLASRDAAWMKPLYEYLGLTVGVIGAGQVPDEKRAAYAADITYGTNNEFGFDYLRDNMAFRLEERVQRPLHFAIIDEVDSILIDEARTPLIISGATDDSTELYERVNQIVPRLIRQQEEEGPGDFSMDEKARQVHLTEEGHQHIEELLMETGLLEPGESLYDAANIALMHHVNAALRAHHLFQRNVHYIIQGGKVVIVDEFTGRTMPGRRWSDGLHQAVEAKEGVDIQPENHTLASITFQNYFRLYDKLGGMTGTADTEAFEFHQIYGLDVVVIPTNRPMVRKDLPDQVFLTRKEKYEAIVADVKSCRERVQPVLVGTASIEASEVLSALLKREGIAHEVLNAKQHEREADIVAQAGRPGAVTIATNMAGRGTDIILGGNPELERRTLGEDATPEQIAAVEAAWKAAHDTVLEAGGLHIIGSERHESRRIDNQLRGRAGRQGDPGSSRFYLSFEDDLLRIFGSERLSSLMQRLGMTEGEAMEHPWVTRAIENAQRKVESHNFDIRKQLLEYDDVANEQRRVIYQQRNDLLHQGDVAETITRIREDVVRQVTFRYLPPDTVEDLWDAAGLDEVLRQELGIDFGVARWLESDRRLEPEGVVQRIIDRLLQAYRAMEGQIGPQAMRQVERSVMLRVIDQHWRDHLANMDYLRQGIHLRGYAQKNPRQEYKREAFEMFSQMLETIKQETLFTLHKLQFQPDEPTIRPEPAPVRMQFEHAQAGAMAGEAEAEAGQEPRSQTPVRVDRKVGRNEPCPCGSGKKFKHCHGRLS